MATATTRSGNVGSPGRHGMFFASAAITGLLVLLAVSCGGSPDSDAAPPSARGAELYQANCASCHGSDLRGTELGPSHLSIVYEPSHHSDDSFRSAIANGAGQHHWNFGNMPAVPGVSDADVDEIIAFIRSEQEREGFEPYERP